MALTATADETTRADIVRLLALHDPLIQISSFDRPNIRYTLVEKYKPLDQLWFFIKAQKVKRVLSIAIAAAKWKKRQSVCKNVG